MEFKKAGYKISVLPQDIPRVIHYCGQNAMMGYDEERLKFIHEYIIA